MLTIGERVRNARKLKKMTQEELAKNVELSKNYIYLIESGRETPGKKAARDIAKVLGVSENWILTGEGEMVDPLERNAQITRFVGEALKGTDPSVKRRFITVLSQATTEELEAIEQFALRLAAEYQKETKEGG